MISKSEIIDYCVKNNILTYDKETDKIIFIDSGVSSTADELVDIYRKKIGQSFDCIYDDHISCFNILKCTECGTYIFQHYDEDYEYNLKCPVCTDYKTGFKYYTTKDVEEDVNKKKEIDMYLEFARLDVAANKRYIKRGNLYDFEKTHKKILFNGKNKKIDIQLTGFGKWDLQAEINVWKIEGAGASCKHHVKIPISPKTILFFIKHKTKCKVTWANV